MEELLRDPIGLVFYPAEGRIPDWATVHHNDYDKVHNCHGNLMLLDRHIHNALSRAYRAYLLEHYAEWMEKIARENAEEEEDERDTVPF